MMRCDLYGKVIVLTVSDIEEYIFYKVMAALTDNTVSAVIYESLQPVLTFPNLEIRINEQVVYHNGIPVPLTHHEFFTLLYLVQHPSWVLSQSMIYEAVWKAPSEYCGSAVTNVISQLRKKIGDRYIETVINSGY